MVFTEDMSWADSLFPLSSSLSLFPCYNDVSSLFSHSALLAMVMICTPFP